jgi:hypothetical protein
LVFLFSACDENGGNGDTDEDEVMVAECPVYKLNVVSSFPISLSPQEESELITTGELRLRLIYRPYSDITTWTKASSPGFGTSQIFGIAHGFGYYVAGGAGKIRYSQDANTWTSATTLDGFSSYAVQAMTYGGYGGGRLVAVGGSGTIAYSTNPDVWTAAGTPSFGGSHIWAACYGNGKYIAGGDSKKIAYSTDGNTWTQASSVGFSSGYIVYNMCYDSENARYFAIAYSGTSTEVCSSTDGNTWTLIGDYSDFGSSNAIAVAYGKGICVAGNYWSTDLSTWNAASSPPSSSTITDMIYSNGLFIASCSNSKIAYSLDGDSWTEVTLPSWGGAAIYGMTHSGGKVVIVGNSGQIAFAVY